MNITYYISLFLDLFMKLYWFLMKVSVKRPNMVKPNKVELQPEV
jgi:hypothetical protein